jgi:hypothetical protein
MPGTASVSAIVPTCSPGKVALDRGAFRIV